METEARTEASPATPGRRDPAALFAAGLAGATTAGAVLLILFAPGVKPVWDQSFIAYGFSAGYPHFEVGIVSHLLVGAVNALVPYEPVSSNALIRAIAALLYLGSAGLLAWSLTGRERLWGFVAFLLLVASTRFPFLWLSSELFAGALLMLFLWSLVRGHPFALTGLFLVLFSLSKADLALPGALVGAYLVLRPDPVPRWRRAAALGAMTAALVVPSLFTPSYYGQFGGRSWVAFGQHYGELVRGLQLEPAPAGWGAWVMYVEHAFPGASSVWEAAVGHPRRYLYFVALSVTESSIRLLPAKLIVLIPLAVFFFPRMRASWKVTVLLLLTTIVPIVLMSFLHVRYQARLYPLALFIVFAGLRAGTRPRWQEHTVAAVLVAMLLWQVVDLVPVLRTAHWLPD